MEGLKQVLWEHCDNMGKLRTHDYKCDLVLFNHMSCTFQSDDLVGRCAVLLRIAEDSRLE